MSATTGTAPGMVNGNRNPSAEENTMAVKDLLSVAFGRKATGQHQEADLKVQQQQRVMHDANQLLLHAHVSIQPMGHAATPVLVAPTDPRLSGLHPDVLMSVAQGQAAAPTSSPYAAAQVYSRPSDPRLAANSVQQRHGSYSDMPMPMSYASDLGEWYYYTQDEGKKLRQRRKLISGLLVQVDGKRGALSQAEELRDTPEPAADKTPQHTVLNCKDAPPEVLSSHQRAQAELARGDDEDDDLVWWGMDEEVELAAADGDDSDEHPLDSPGQPAECVPGVEAGSGVAETAGMPPHSSLQAGAQPQQQLATPLPVSISVDAPGVSSVVAEAGPVAAEHGGGVVRGAVTATPAITTEEDPATYDGKTAVDVEDAAVASVTDDVADDAGDVVYKTVGMAPTSSGSSSGVSAGAADTSHAPSVPAIPCQDDAGADTSAPISKASTCGMEAAKATPPCRPITPPLLATSLALAAANLTPPAMPATAPGTQPTSALSARVAVQPQEQQPPAGSELPAEAAPSAATTSTTTVAVTAGKLADADQPAPPAAAAARATTTVAVAAASAPSAPSPSPAAAAAAAPPRAIPAPSSQQVAAEPHQVLQMACTPSSGFTSSAIDQRRYTQTPAAGTFPSSLFGKLLAPASFQPTLQLGSSSINVDSMTRALNSNLSMRTR